MSDAEADRRWDPWTPSVVAALLARTPVHWYVAGGWAIDLFLGSLTRAHTDLEIAVPRTDFHHLADAFPGYAWDAVGDGRAWPYPAVADDPDIHQTWLRDLTTGAYHLDVFREPHDGPTWICRRDPSITLPYTEVIHHTGSGIPYSAPEITLLFKAKANRVKDATDFTRCLPLLSPVSRDRLRTWLDRVHPGHPWLTSLET